MLITGESWGEEKEGGSPFLAIERRKRGGERRVGISSTGRERETTEKRGRRKGESHGNKAF